MALTDALFEGKAQLAGTPGLYAASPHEVIRACEGMRAIPVTDGDFAATLDAVTPDVLVDARMRKRAQPEVQIALAPLTIGLGPNFEAGITVEIVIETAWGERLGAGAMQEAVFAFHPLTKPLPQGGEEYETR